MSGTNSGLSLPVLELSWPLPFFLHLRVLDPQKKAIRSRLNRDSGGLSFFSKK